MLSKVIKWCYPEVREEDQKEFILTALLPSLVGVAGALLSAVYAFEMMGTSTFLILLLYMLGFVTLAIKGFMNFEKFVRR